jgi:low affinity Fe/Cu permease
MAEKRRMITGRFEQLSEGVTRAAGSTGAFIAALAVVAGWAATGPLFHFSSNWQLFINTGTTIVTFLMVFLIQRTHNKDAMALHLKLNELVAAVEGASNRLIDVESLSERELTSLNNYFKELVKLAAADRDLQHSHSIEEARTRHSAKQRR